MFTINGKQWRIYLVSPLNPNLKRTDGSYAIGSCDDNTKTIYLNRNLNKYKLKQVLCHEITHAAMFSYNVELTLQQEELLADLLATYGQEIIDITNAVFLRLKRKWEGY